MIVDVRKVSTGDRLIKIRNPWGKGEWNGDWSDKSKKWTPALKKEVGFTDAAEDGIFWMEAKDFVKKFSEIGVCKVHEGYQYNSIQYDNINLKEKLTSVFIKLTITKKSHMFVEVNQADKRYYKSDPVFKSWKYARVRMLIARLDGDDKICKYETSGSGASRNTTAEHYFHKKGEYLITV